MIKFDQVSKRYPGNSTTLSDISFEIEAGKLVFVTGISGAGKSTLLKLIAGLEQPSAGTVLINHQNVSHLNPSAVPFLRRKFGLVFQDHKLLYDRNCYENVALPLYINGISSDEAAGRIRAALDKVGLLNKEKVMPITMSGGEQQRLAIARAIVSRPDCLIADEPTGNLDEGYANNIMDLFYDFHRVGVTVIVASHQAPQNLAQDLQSKLQILHLSHGELVA